MFSYRFKHMFARCALLGAVLLCGCAPGDAGSSTPAATPARSVWPTVANLPGLGLTGRLVFIDISAGGTPRLVALNPATGDLKALFVPPENGTLASAVVSPDGTLAVLAYAPPAAEGFAPYGFTDLYMMPASGAGEPRLLVQKTRTNESFYQPAWSPDDREVYYGHFVELENDGGYTTTYTVERIAYPAGKPEVLASQAIWPHLSPDGSTLAYVGFVNPGGLNTLMTAGPEGTDATTIVPASAFGAIDALAFSPDGRWLVFSAVSASPASTQSWLDRALGVQSAYAHSLPSDLWRVPLAGGAPQRLTVLAETGLSPAYSPDGTHIAFICAGGLFVMNVDGSGLVKLLDGPALGTLSWVSAR